MAGVTISKFRKDLFTYVEAVGEGELVEFTHKGIRFRLIRPDVPPVDKLSRITPLAADAIVGTPEEFAAAHEQMSRDVMSDWEASWNSSK